MARKPPARYVDADGKTHDAIELFGNAPLSSGPYRLKEIDGTDGVWHCRHCRAYFLATVPHKPPAKCAKCGQET